MTKQAAQQAMRDGRFREARDHLLALLNSADDGPELRYNLAMVQVRLSDFAGAAEQFQYCARAAPDNPEILNNLGNCQRLSGNLGAARQNLDRALRLAPGHPGVLANRGWLLLQMQQPADARDCFDRLLKTDRSQPEAFRGLAEALQQAGDLEAAKQVLSEATGTFPDSPALLQSLGTCYSRMREPEKALEYFGRALELNPDNPESLLNHGICAEQLGELALAERQFQRAIALRPGFAPAHFHLAHLATHEPDPAEVNAIEQALQQAPGPQAGIELGFALGKSLARLGQHPRAFQAFRRAREAAAQLEAYPMDKALARIEKIRAARHEPALAGKCDAVFVVGMPRSGTTLVDQILASHPGTVSLGESGAVTRVLDKYRSHLGRDYPCGQILSAEQRAVLENTLRGELPGGDRVAVDTTPANLAYVGLLAELLPGARFVYCQRDSRDTCVSIFEQPLSKAHGYANRLVDLGRYYGASFSLAQRWRDMLGSGFYTLQYEELIAEPRAAIPALLDACGLPFDPACLEFHRHRRAVITPSAAQVREPVHARSIGRWRHYGDFLAPLLEQLPGESFYPP